MCVYVYNDIDDDDVFILRFLFANTLIIYDTQWGK